MCIGLDTEARRAYNSGMSDQDIIEALGLGGVLDALPAEPGALNPFTVGDRVVFGPLALFGARGTGTVRAADGDWLLVLADQAWPKITMGGYHTEPTRLLRARIGFHHLIDAGPYGDIRWVRPESAPPPVKRRRR